MKPKRMTLEDKLWLHQRDQDLKHATLVGGIAGSVSMTGITSTFVHYWSTLNPSNSHHEILTHQSISVFGSRFLHATRFRQVSLIGLSLVIGSVTGYLYADAQALQQLDELATTSVLRQEFQS